MRSAARTRRSFPFRDLGCARTPCPYGLRRRYRDGQPKTSGRLRLALRRAHSVQRLAQALADAESIGIGPFEIPFPSRGWPLGGHIARVVLTEGAPALFDNLLDWVLHRAEVDLLPLQLSLEALCDRIESCQVGTEDGAPETSAFRRIALFSWQRGFEIVCSFRTEYSSAMLSVSCSELNARLDTSLPETRKSR